MSRILVIDDETEILDIISRGLRKEGCDVDITHMGKTGLKMAGGKKYDLVLLDLMMSYIGGFEIVQKLRKKEETSGIPIVAISVLKREENLGHGNAPEFDSYLEKPFTINELVSIVEGILIN